MCYELAKRAATAKAARKDWKAPPMGKHADESGGIDCPASPLSSAPPRKLKEVVGDEDTSWYCDLEVAGDEVASWSGDLEVIGDMVVSRYETVTVLTDPVAVPLESGQSSKSPSPQYLHWKLIPSALHPLVYVKGSHLLSQT
jgi:hypothetical protein